MFYIWGFFMENKLELISPKGRVRGGIEPGHFKNTADSETLTMPAPKTVCIPMQQHIGAPCLPTVSVGDEVFVGTKIGDIDRLVSAPIHSSVSGKVTAIKEVTLSGGGKSTAVIIENDGKDTPNPDLKPPVIENEEQLLAAVRESGLVGLGGAGFPAHVKLKKQEDKPLNTLIINGAECEPFITADYRECLENTDDILRGVYLLLEIMGFERVIIAVEDNKPEAIRAMYDVISNERDKENRVRLMKIKTHYPQGAEKVLIHTATGRKLGLGKLPADVGCVVMNITSVSTIGKYLKTGMPLTRKRITVDGDIVKNPGNISVPLGATVNDVIEFCGGLNAKAHKIILGGPMMGAAIADTGVPILKQNNAILAFSEETAKMSEPIPCIRCGRCANACPMHLSPFHIAAAIQAGDIDEVDKLYANYCMECGCCSYSCPSKRPLVETMRRAKALLKNR